MSPKKSTPQPQSSSSGQPLAVSDLMAAHFMPPPPPFNFTMPPPPPLVNGAGHPISITELLAAHGPPPPHIMAPPIPNMAHIRSPSHRAPTAENGRQHPYKQRTTGGASPRHGGGQRGAQRYQVYEDYWPVERVHAALASKAVAKGALRINVKNYEEAYIANPYGCMDIMVNGVRDRNRALHSDIVVVALKPRSHWIVLEKSYEAWKKRMAGATGVIVEPCVIDLYDVTTDEDAASSTSHKAEETIESGSRQIIVDLAEGTIEEDIVLPIAKPRSYDRETMRRLSGSPASDDVDMPTLLATMSLQRSPSSQKMAAARGPLGDGAIPARPSGSTVPQIPDKPTGARKGFRTLADLGVEGSKVPDDCLQHTGEVVFVHATKNSRAAVGSLKLTNNNRRDYAFFVPKDSRMPRMMIPAKEVDPNFFNRPQDYAKFIYIARVATDWPATQPYPRGKLYRSLGVAGEIEPETEGLLVQYDIDTREFSSAVVDCLPKVGPDNPWTIPDTELAYRRDLRKETVFTIDPATARDLDDALHVKDLGNDVFEVGVHIADVAYFVHEESEVDAWAARRATSTYLVHKVVPMLPRLLCEELCSLNAGLDRLTFSVIWRLHRGEVVDEWIGRTVINSCVKLAYDHAQGFIDEPGRNWLADELPPIFNGRSPSEICDSAVLLNKVAVLLRKRRYEHGALRLDMPKLVFTLDKETGMPSGCKQYEQKESNRLVEEFMLLANISVAQKIEQSFPTLALLRRHPPPDAKQMREVMDTCASLGFPLSGVSSGALQATLNKYRMSKDKLENILHVLQQLLMKPMQLAQYFCTGSMQSVDQYRHYALSIPLYTHFTSPIRRYADVIVHRLLAASLKYAPVPRVTTDDVEEQATVCNDRKLASKMVSEASADMFFGLFVKECGPIEEPALVMNVLDHSFDVLITRFGMVKRVYCNQLHTAGWLYNDVQPPSLKLTWTGEHGGYVTQMITLTARCQVILVAIDDQPLQYRAVIKPPEGASTAKIDAMLTPKKKGKEETNE